MTPDEFIRKWSPSELTERQGSHSHFNDVCALVGHKPPAEADSKAEWFCFDKHVAKHLGGKGFADVWMDGRFGWEYKGKHKDLDAAYEQLIQYKDDLGNPPLLVVCDFERIIIHTNFTGTKPDTCTITLADLEQPDKLEILRNVFFATEKLKPGYIEQLVTEKTAAHIAEIAESVRSRVTDPTAVAHFLDRIVFCLFAQNVKLLPEKLFTTIVGKSSSDPKRFAKLIGELFTQMANGGDFGAETIRHFNGNLFDTSPVLELTLDEIKAIESATEFDWRKVDASIFGTLFERGLDPAKRAQIGAHYTSRADIETIVEPVVMQPLRREWDATRERVDKLLAGDAKKSRAKAEQEILRFLERLRTVRVLDPAGGSGNFLYVTLQKLLDLEKEANDYLAKSGFTPQFPHISPLQLYCIEINSYAHDLAQMTVLIGYIQWLNAHGYGFPAEPILQRLDKNFFCKDAILDLSDPANPQEPTWPAVDFIVSNPPFLGTKKLRGELTDEYVEKLFKLYEARIPGFSDLCCYWFEKARQQIVDGKCKRAGLLATQGIRGGLNREVLKRIKESGDIFFAESDRPWILDGANVHVSMVGFDSGDDKMHVLDGQSVTTINANLTSAADTTQAQRLSANTGVGFIADVKAGKFDISAGTALAMLQAPNPHGKPNSDVVVPWVNSLDILRRPRNFWIVDFPSDSSAEAAAQYETPFAHVKEYVYPKRSKVKRPSYRDYWWIHAEPCDEMRQRIAGLSRFLVTTTTSKHRVFAWMQSPTLPDHQLVAFARTDDYFFGLLQSHAHEVWALKLGTRLETRPRYTPTTCFETFPFPDVTPEQQAAIAAAAKELDTLRTNWLNPPEWMREEVLEFPASTDGPWAHFVKDGVARYPRLVPKDADCAKKLAKQTLTNLYNKRPDWLSNAHRTLDEAVCAAYGWTADLADEQILERLLALNQERSKTGPQPAQSGRKLSDIGDFNPNKMGGRVQIQDVTDQVKGNAVQIIGGIQPAKKSAKPKD